MLPTLILASSSIYRKELLNRLRLDFQCISPSIDESRLPNEPASALVTRLAIEKASAVKQTLKDDSIIIASDQVALLNDCILGKPHTTENAIKQLLEFSGKKVTFLTSLCVLNSKTNRTEMSIDEYHVYFKALSLEEITNYVLLERPLDCAGSFKCEGLGVVLFEKMEGSDPNSLIGLPLISLCKLLKRHNINPLLDSESRTNINKT
ncbi:Maf family protein [Marinomonas sp. 2405UD68-3]|uniref:Maf family protein n=1 Tax=Marinomonas sp. 2405UD68-3 TaxID=3391835 RepID=UPI0039C8D10D